MVPSPGEQAEDFFETARMGLSVFRQPEVPFACNKIVSRQWNSSGDLLRVSAGRTLTGHDRLIPGILQDLGQGCYALLSQSLISQVRSERREDTGEKSLTDLVQHPLIPNLALVERVPGDRLRHLA
jgi:hypothetical protein